MTADGAPALYAMASISVYLASYSFLSLSPWLHSSSSWSWICLYLVDLEARISQAVYQYISPVFERLPPSTILLTTNCNIPLDSI